MAREGPSYIFDRFTVDTAERTLRSDGQVLPLPPKVFDTLAVLLENAGRVVEKEELLTRVWPDTFIEEGNLSQNIFHLRRVLGDDRNGHRIIETVPKRGYRFVAEVRLAGVEGAVALPAPAWRSVPTSTWLLAVILLALIGEGLWRWWPVEPQFRERGWVVMAAFENRTGEPIFDGTVEFALERELSASRFVNVLPAPRVQDALALMRRPPETRLDAILAREVALRDGEAQIVITGRVDKLGSRYQLGVALMQAATGAVLAAFSEDAAGQEAVLDATRTLARRVREELGEQLPQVSAPPRLEKATTTSLRALQLFSQGLGLVNQYKWNPAAQLLEQALAADADFATAHIYLAHCYSNLDKHEEAAPHYQEAFRLADTTTDRERYFILGSYYAGFAGDNEKAIEKYEVLVRLYPDDYWGVNNLEVAYSDLGRMEEALPYSVRRAELRPNDLYSVYWAMSEMMRFGRDPARAEALMRKAHALSQKPDASQTPELWAAITLFGVRRRMWLADSQGALQELERVRTSLPSYTSPRRQALESRVGDYFLYLGRMRAAEEQYSALPEDGIPKHEGLAWVAEERGDMAALRFHLRRQLALGADGVEPWMVRQLVRAGMVAEAAARLNDERAQKSYEPRFVRLSRAQIAIAKGRIPQAIGLLTELHGDATVNRDVILFAVAIPLAEILEQRGDLAGAANVLRQALEANPSPIILTDARQAKFRLLRLYGKLGREQEALALESEVRKSLVVADPDHPMLIALEREARIRASK